MEMITTSKYVNSSGSLKNSDENLNCREYKNIEETHFSSECATNESTTVTLSKCSQNSTSEHHDISKSSSEERSNEDVNNLMYRLYINSDNEQEDSSDENKTNEETLYSSDYLTNKSTAFAFSKDSQNSTYESSLLVKKGLSPLSTNAKIRDVHHDASKSSSAERSAHEDVNNLQDRLYINSDNEKDDSSDENETNEETLYSSDYLTNKFTAFTVSKDSQNSTSESSLLVKKGLSPLSTNAKIRDVHHDASKSSSLERSAHEDVNNLQDRLYIYSDNEQEDSSDENQTNETNKDSSLRERGKDHSKHSRRQKQTLYDRKNKDEKIKFKIVTPTLQDAYWNDGNPFVIDSQNISNESNDNQYNTINDFCDHLNNDGDNQNEVISDYHTINFYPEDSGSNSVSSSKNVCEYWVTGSLPETLSPSLNLDLDHRGLNDIYIQNMHSQQKIINSVSSPESGYETSITESSPQTFSFLPKLVLNHSTENVYKQNMHSQHKIINSVSSSESICENSITKSSPQTFSFLPKLVLNHSTENVDEQNMHNQHKIINSVSSSESSCEISITESPPQMFSFASNFVLNRSTDDGDEQDFLDLLFENKNTTNCTSTAGNLLVNQEKILKYSKAKENECHQSSKKQTKITKTRKNKVCNIKNPEVSRTEVPLACQPFQNGAKATLRGFLCDEKYFAVHSQILRDINRQISENSKTKEDAEVIYVKDDGSKESERRTNLHNAVLNFELEEIYCLVEIHMKNKQQSRTALTLTDKHGKTAIDYAIDNNLTLIVDYLKGYGCHPSHEVVPYPH